MITEREELGLILLLTTLGRAVVVVEYVMAVFKANLICPDCQMLKNETMTKMTNILPHTFIFSPPS